MWKCPKCGRTFIRTHQGHYCGKAPQTVLEYIDSQPAETRVHLTEMMIISAAVCGGDAAAEYHGGRAAGRCMFEFASSLGTVGLSIGLTGPTTRAATLLVEMAGMLLGRLEIFLVFTGQGSAVFLMRQRRRGSHRDNR